MKVLNVKVLAKHNGPESCGGARKRTVEALAGEHSGCVSSREIVFVGADLVGGKGRPRRGVRFGEDIPCLTRSKTTCMYARTMYGSREILGFSAVEAERIVKPKGIRR